MEDPIGFATDAGSHCLKRLTIKRSARLGVLPKTRTVEPISLKLMTTNFYTTLGGAFLVHLNGDFIIMSYPIHTPDWWIMPDFLFLPCMFIWACWGMYALWKFVAWLAPARRHERAIKRVETEFKIKERRQKLELELAWNKDSYNRDKAFYDNLRKNVSKW